MDLRLDNLDYDTIVEAASPDVVMADLGCGDAKYHQQLYDIVEAELEKEGFEGALRLYGLDSSESKIEVARKSNTSDCFEYHVQNIGEGEEYPFEIADIVVSQHLLCDAEDTQAVYEEAAEIARDIDGTNQVHSTC